MLALAARTLVDQKGYTLPEDIGAYTGAFEDWNNISQWAESLVALAVREGLIDRGGMLNPGEDITREQAAVILYRLFLLLYEVSPSALEIPLSGGVIALIAGAAAVVVAGGGTGAVLCVRRRRKKITM